MTNREAFYIYENWHADPREAITHQKRMRIMQRWQRQIRRI